MTAHLKNGEANRTENANPKIESSCNYANFYTDIIGTFHQRWNIFTNGRFIVEFKSFPGQRDRV